MQTDTKQTDEKESSSNNDRRSERINWSKATLALKIAKVSVCGYISAEWEAFLQRWSTEELEGLPDFFENVDAGRIIHTKNGWIIQTGCQICKKIFDNILGMQQNATSKNLNWKPDGVQNKTYSGSKIIKTNTYPKSCEICKKKHCLFQAERDGFDLQNQDFSDFGKLQCHTPEALKNIAEYYWRIGNMFMFYGRETNFMKNTSPADTEPALVFKMMKNCKLFDRKDVSMYDQVLEARNYLMHSPNQRIPNADFDICIEAFINVLTEFKVDCSTCFDGIQEIQTLKDANVTEFDEVSLIRQATLIQTKSVQYDLTVKGICGVSKYVLEGILTVNKIRFTTGNVSDDGDVKNTDIETIKKQDRALGLIGGVLFGATIGTYQGATHGAKKGEKVMNNGKKANTLGEKADNDFLRGIGRAGGAVLGGLFGADKENQ